MTKRIIVLLALAISYVHTVFALGIQHYASGLHAFHPLYEETSTTSPLLEGYPAIFDIQPTLFKDTTFIDFEKRQITFLRYDTFTGAPIWQYHYNELDEYLRSTRGYYFTALWLESGKKSTEAGKKKEGPPKLELVAPVHYPPWAIRVLGKEPPKLSIKGFQSITVSFKRRKLETGESSADERKPTGGFGFDYDNMFTIRGSVGRLINIEIKTGKEKGGDDFSLKDQMKKLKIEYKADPDSTEQLEDEIIQEVVAGYTNFQMPGQGLAGYSGSHEGLFGIKMRSQWGPLSLTTILSRESAETQKTTLDPTGKTAGKVTINETEFARNIYFFLDSIFLHKYTGEIDTNVEVTELEVYKIVPYDQNYNKQDYVWAFYGDSDSSKSAEATLFKRLKEYEDFEVDKKKGWIRFLNASTVGQQDVIAIYLLKSDGDKKGDTKMIPLQTGDLGRDYLWVLKSRYRDIVNPADLLMWRNVYYLPQDARLDEFKLKILRKKGDKGVKYNDQDSLFSSILGVTDKKGKPYTENEELFDFERKYMIFPPWKIYSDSLKDTIYSNHPFENPALGKLTGGDDNLNSTVYDDTSNKVERYDIITTGTSRRTTFNIGWGIIPGSEKLVTKSGKELKKGKDYHIEYDFGQITLLSELAKSASEIEVDYQAESIFMFESKRFLGAYGKLGLPNIGRESYIATSVMGHFTSSRDKIPRVGHEPFNRFLFDTNLRLDFEPEWMTNFVNFIPLIKTTSPSSATMDFEVAYSHVAADRENDGEAYVDNFQSSEKGYPLGEAHVIWHQASPSADLLQGVNNSNFLYHPPAWRRYWYSPILNAERTGRNEIWKLTQDDIDNKNLYMSTLRLNCQPLPTNDTLLEMVKISGVTQVNPWTGIMTVIPGSLKDRRKDRYFEFYVKNKDRRGVLYIDIGEVSEDLSLDGGPPNKKTNDEKFGARPGERDSEADLGLDSLPDSLESYLFPNFRDSVAPFWDTLGFENSLLGDFYKDPARDNWDRYDANHTENKKKTNGTQGDEYLTSEDINGENRLDTRENFFRARIDFRNIDTCVLIDSSRITDSTKVYGWYPIRIPINIREGSNYYDSIGNPNWNNVRFVRLIWTDFEPGVMTKENKLEFTELRFTGNQYEILPTEGDTAKEKINVTVLNTVDDKGYYYRPRRIEKYDKEKKLIKDYALRLVYNDLKAGEEAIVKRVIPSYQKIDLSLYKEVRMYINEVEKHIYAPNSTGNIVDAIDSIWISGHKENFIEYVFRFGNTDSSYYEYKTRSLKGHWEKDKGFRIDLKKLSELKQAYHVEHGDVLDSINLIDTLDDGSIIRIYSKTGNLPTFSNIQWIAMGVVRHEDAVGFAEGEIWVNGVRVKGINPIQGWAFRANLNTQWADFMDISANLSYDDADFRQMSHEPHITKDTEITAGIDAQWTVSKFLPDKLGINIPFGTGVLATLSRPKQRPGTDIYLTGDDDKADGIGDMAKDFADLIFNSDLSEHETEAEHYEKNQVQKTWYTSYSKTANSDNPLVNLTADRLTTNYSYTKDSTTESEGLLPEDDKENLERGDIGDDHIDVKSNRAHNTSLKYDLSPRKPAKWTSWSPFIKIKAKNFPRSVKNYEFKLLPNRLNFDLFDGQYTKTYEYNSLQDAVNTSSVEKTFEGLRMSHGFQFSYSPISPLIETNYDIALSRDFDDALNKWGHWGTGRFIKERVVQLDPVWKKYWVTYAEKARNQNASLRFEPQIFDWLTHTADYRTRYTQNPRTYKDDPNYLTSNVNSEFGFSTNFRIRSLFTNISERTEKIKGLSTTFEKMGAGLDKINLTTFNFTYNASCNLNNDYLSTDFLADKEIWLYDFFKYQLGVKGRGFRDIITGNMDDDNAFGGMRYRWNYEEELFRNDRRIADQNYTIKTSMALPKPLDVTISPISLSWKRGYTILPNPMIMDSAITFPELQIGASSNVLEKIPFVKQKMKSLGIRSSYRLAKTVKKRYASPNDTASEIQSDINRGHSWDPLISIDGLLKKWPINVDYAYRFSMDSTVSLKGKSEIDNSGSKMKSYGNTWNVKYTIPGKPNRELKLLNRWTIPIKGETVMNMDVTHTSNRKTYERIGEDKPEEERDWGIMVHPKVIYDLTDNVDGLVEYIFDKSYESYSETTRTNNTFALTITIHFN